MQDMGIKVLLEGNNLQRLLVGLSVTLWISFLHWHFKRCRAISRNHHDIKK